MTKKDTVPKEGAAEADQLIIKTSVMNFTNSFRIILLTSHTTTKTIFLPIIIRLARFQTWLRNIKNISQEVESIPLPYPSLNWITDNGISSLL